MRYGAQRIVPLSSRRDDTSSLEKRVTAHDGQHPKGCCLGVVVSASPQALWAGVIHALNHCIVSHLAKTNPDAGSAQVGAVFHGSYSVNDLAGASIPHPSMDDDSFQLTLWMS